MTIRELATHSARYVTVAELADYWSVSHKFISELNPGPLRPSSLGLDYIESELQPRSSTSSTQWWDRASLSCRRRSAFR
jgi:hypothetical protein